MQIARKVEIFKVVILTYASLAFFGVIVGGIFVREAFSRWFFDSSVHYRQLFYMIFAAERNLSMIVLFVIPVLMAGMVSFTQQELYEAPVLVDILIGNFVAFAVAASVRVLLIFKKLMILTEKFAEYGEQILKLPYYKVVKCFGSIQTVSSVMDVIWITTLMVFVLVTLSRVMVRLKHV